MENFEYLVGAEHAPIITNNSVLMTVLVQESELATVEQGSDVENVLKPEGLLTISAPFPSQILLHILSIFLLVMSVVENSQRVSQTFLNHLM